MNVKLKKKKLEISKEVIHKNFKFKKRGKLVNAEIVEMKRTQKSMFNWFGKEEGMINHL